MTGAFEGTGGVEGAEGAVEEMGAAKQAVSSVGDSTGELSWLSPVTKPD